MAKKYVAGSIACGLLTAIGILMVIISLINAGNSKWVLNDCGNVLLLLIIAYYAFVGYKKPHGNLLKYIMLFYVARRLLGLRVYIQSENEIEVISRATEIGLLCYVAGRLVKVKENLIIMSIITICYVTHLASGISSGSATIGVVTPFVVWLDICVAYFLRYKEHKEAGLIDAPIK